MKLLFYIAAFNIIGVVLSMLYGIFGGSGGETTTGVFLGVAFVGATTAIVCLVLPFFQPDLFKSKWYWLLLLFVIGVAETSIVDWKVIIGL